MTGVLIKGAIWTQKDRHTEKIMADTQGKDSQATKMMQLQDKECQGMLANAEVRRGGRDFPAGPVAKTPHSQCKGTGSRDQMPHVATKDPVCPDEDQRYCVPQLRPSTAKLINYSPFFFFLKKEAGKDSLQNHPKEHGPVKLLSIDFQAAEL